MNTNIMVQDRANEIADFPLIYSRIYDIRGQKVMRDFDLAVQYGMETALLKRQVRRNIVGFKRIKN